MSYGTKSTIPTPSNREDDTPVTETEVSPRRRRTIRAAEAVLDRELKLPPTARPEALARIRRARQPVREAKRFIEHCKKVDLGETGRRDPDLADVRELEVKLIRRDGSIWPPQSTMLNRLASQTAEGLITAEEFRSTAAALWAMPQTLPKSFLRAESILQGR